MKESVNFGLGSFPHSQQAGGIDEDSLVAAGIFLEWCKEEGCYYEVLMLTRALADCKGDRMGCYIHVT